MILKFGVKNGMLEYRQIDIKFPTNHDKKMVEVLTRENINQVYHCDSEILGSSAGVVPVFR